MKLPRDYIQHLDHRITSLLSFTMRRELGFFGPDHGEQREMGDLYRASLEGAAIMIRLLIEFLGVQADISNPGKLKRSNTKDAILGVGCLSQIQPLRIEDLDDATEEFLSRVHSEASKRTAHPAFNKNVSGLDPDDLTEISKLVLKEIWERCYSPEPITVHRDIFRLMDDGHWSDIPFKCT